MEVLKFFYILRIFYAVIIIGIVVGSVLWAMRHGQFNSQQKAANLPLEIDEKENN